MKRLIVLLMFLAACSSPSPAPSPSPESSPTTVTSSSPSPVSSQCQDMTHVYNPQRLTVLAPCVSVSGIVKVVRSEADGDKHILVQPDPGQPDPNGGNWVNSCNATCNGGAEQGDLVTEPVCVGTVVQPDAIDACLDYHNPTPVPRVGDHVTVTGSWVLDTVHGWNEIHPATYVIN